MSEPNENLTHADTKFLHEVGKIYAKHNITRENSPLSAAVMEAVRVTLKKDEPTTKEVLVTAVFNAIEQFHRTSAPRTAEAVENSRKTIAPVFNDLMVLIHTSPLPERLENASPTMGEKIHQWVAEQIDVLPASRHDYTPTERKFIQNLHQLYAQNNIVKGAKDAELPEMILATCTRLIHQEGESASGDMKKALTQAIIVFDETHPMNATGQTERQNDLRHMRNTVKNTISKAYAPSR